MLCQQLPNKPKSLPQFPLFPALWDRLKHGNLTGKSQLRQELQLDLELVGGPRAVQELVLHIHSCPQLPKTAKRRGQMSNMKVIVLESLSTESRAY